MILSFVIGIKKTSRGPSRTKSYRVLSDRVGGLSQSLRSDGNGKLLGKEGKLKRTVAAALR